MVFIRFSFILISFEADILGVCRLRKRVVQGRFCFWIFLLRQIRRQLLYPGWAMRANVTGKYRKAHTMATANTLHQLIHIFLAKKPQEAAKNIFKL